MLGDEQTKQGKRGGGGRASHTHAGGSRDPGPPAPGSLGWVAELLNGLQDSLHVANFGDAQVLWGGERGAAKLCSPGWSTGTMLVNQGLGPEPSPPLCPH